MCKKPESGCIVFLQANHLGVHLDTACLGSMFAGSWHRVRSKDLNKLVIYKIEKLEHVSMMSQFLKT